MYRELVDREHGPARRGLSIPLATNPSLVQRLKHTGTLGEGPGSGASNAPVSAASWSADGSLLISGSEDAVLKIWSVSGSHRAPLQSFDTGERVHVAAGPHSSILQ